MATENVRERAAAQEELRRRTLVVMKSKALMPYGTPAELQEFIERLKFMLPGGEKLKPPEVAALAQVSFAHGLNPIIGECYWIPGKGFAPGIRGLRRKGRDQLRDWYGQESNIEIRYEPIAETDVEARAKWMVPPGALAFLAIGTVSAKRQHYVRDAETLRKALGPDAPYEVILSTLGPIPQTVGLGYMTEQQMFELDFPEWTHVCSNAAKNTSERKGDHGKYKCRELKGFDLCPDCGKEPWVKPSGMPHAQRAMKRAEAHFWKQECDLPFEVQPDSDVYEEGDFVDVSTIARPAEDDNLPRMTPEQRMEYETLREESSRKEAEAAQMTPEERRAAGVEATATLFPTMDEADQRAALLKTRQKPNYWPPQVLKSISDAGLAANEFEAAGALGYSTFDQRTSISVALWWMGEYQAAKAAGSQPPDAGAAANNAWAKRLEKGV